MKQTEQHKRLMKKAAQTVEEARVSDQRNWSFCAGNPYRVTRWLLFSVAAALGILLLAQWFGLLLAGSDASSTSESYALLMRNTQLTGVCLLLDAVAAVLIPLRRDAVAALLSVVEAILFLPSQNLTLALLVEDGGWRRLVMYTLPTVLCALFAVYLLICHISDRVRVQRTFDDFVRRIQATHTSSDGQITTAEQWDAYVEEFLSEPVHIKPKKSLRKKAKKQREADAKEED